MNNTSGVFINHSQLRALIKDVTDIAADKVIKALSKADDGMMSMHAASGKFGRKLIERYIAEGVIKRYRDAPGKMWRLDRIEIETAIVTENRIAHLTHNS